MTTVFWDAPGILPVDFLEGQITIISVNYESVLKKFTKAFADKYLGKLHQGVLLHHDNVPSHSSHQQGEFSQSFDGKSLDIYLAALT